MQIEYCVLGAGTSAGCSETRRRWCRPTCMLHTLAHSVSLPKESARETCGMFSLPKKKCVFFLIFSLCETETRARGIFSFQNPCSLGWVFRLKLSRVSLAVKKARRPLGADRESGVQARAAARLAAFLLKKKKTKTKTKKKRVSRGPRRLLREEYPIRFRFTSRGLLREGESDKRCSPVCFIARAGHVCQNRRQQQQYAASGFFSCDERCAAPAPALEDM